MAHTEDNFSVASFDHIDEVARLQTPVEKAESEPAPAIPPVEVEAAAEGDDNSDCSSSGSNSDDDGYGYAPRCRRPARGSARTPRFLARDSSAEAKPREPAPWVPNPDIQFTLRWEDFDTYRILKEFKSSVPFYLPCDHNDKGDGKRDDNDDDSASVSDYLYGGCDDNGARLNLYVPAGTFRISAEDAVFNADDAPPLPRENSFDSFASVEATSPPEAAPDVVGSTQAEGEEEKTDNAKPAEEEEQAATPVIEFLTTVAMGSGRSGCGYRRRSRVRSRSPTSADGPQKTQTLDVAKAEIRHRSLRIHSSHLINALRAVTEYYPSVNLDGRGRRRSYVEIPLQSCYLGHVYESLRAYKSVSSPSHSAKYANTMAKHIDLLLGLFADRVEEEHAEAADLQLDDVAKFRSLWTMFKPGTAAYVRDRVGKQVTPCVVHNITPNLAGVRRWSYGPTTDKVMSYEIEVWSVEYVDGKFHRQSQSHYVDGFVGEMEISQLAVVPARFLKQEGPGTEWVEPFNEASLGRFCWNVAKSDRPGYLELAPSYDSSVSRPELPGFMSRRILVDYSNRLDVPPSSPEIAPRRRCYVVDDDLDYRPGRIDRPFVGYPPRGRMPVKVAGCRCEACRASSLHRPYSMWHRLDSLDPRVDPMPRCDQYFHAMDKRMPAWLFATQQHERVHARHVRHIAYSPVRDRLVYAPEVQEAIRNIAKSLLPAGFPDGPPSWPASTDQRECSGRFILLHGSAGTGKTSTVENLAEQTRRPLFHLDAHLGDSRNILRNLTHVLELCQRLGGIALVDDADRLFGRRLPGLHEYNNSYYSVVRVLSRYNGVVFLATNRLQAMDPDFLARVHANVHFPPLTDDQRHKIWTGRFNALEDKVTASGRKIFVSPQARAYVLENEDVKRLQWNGIEIRNAMQSAVQLAEAEIAPWGRDAPTSSHLPHGYGGMFSSPHAANREKSSVIVLEKHFKEVVADAQKLRSCLALRQAAPPRAGPAGDDVFPAVDAVPSPPPLW